MFDRTTIRFSCMGTFRETKYECPACNKPFDIKNDYVNHFLYIHPPVQTCPKCQENMRYEDFCVNPEEQWMIYKCENCGFLGDSWKVLDRVESMEVVCDEVSQNEDKKSNHMQSVRIGLVSLSIMVVIGLFFTFDLKPTLLIPAMSLSIGTVLFISKDWKAQKDNELLGNDTLKRVDNPHKYS